MQELPATVRTKPSIVRLNFITHWCIQKSTKTTWKPELWGGTRAQSPMWKPGHYLSQMFGNRLLSRRRAMLFRENMWVFWTFAFFLSKMCILCKYNYTYSLDIHLWKIAQVVFYKTLHCLFLNWHCFFPSVLSKLSLPSNTCSCATSHCSLHQGWVLHRGGREMWDSTFHWHGCTECIGPRGWLHCRGLQLPFQRLSVSCIYVWHSSCSKISTFP